MGKLLDRLNKQLNTEYKEDAENCLLIYNKLKEIRNGSVWDREWGVFVNTIFKDFPNNERRFKPTVIGETFIKGILNTI